MPALPFRRNFRDVLNNPACLSPASVYDPISARIAESVGYHIGMLAGSIASMSTLAAPDVIVMTLTEVAEQVRRIMRASELGLLIDADHGYGNAFNVFRTIEELEHAGAAAVSIEDTVLPQPFGSDAKSEAVIDTAEMVGKLKAAVGARRDPDFVIAGRTSSLRVEGLKGAIARACAYRETGIDALFVVGVETAEQARALREAANLPIIMGPAANAGPFDRKTLASAGVALLLQGHQPFAAAAKALREVYQHLHEGHPTDDLAKSLATHQELEGWTRAREFSAMRDQYLR